MRLSCRATLRSRSMTQGMLLVSAMRKVQARHIHAEAHEIRDHLLGIARRPYGADDLGPPRLRFEGRIFLRCPVGGS